MDIKLPSHKHPHGIDNLLPNEYRIWVCEECGHLFTDTEIREDEKTGWAHSCKLHPCRKGQRCESHLEPFMPDLKEERRTIDCCIFIDCTFLIIEILWGNDLVVR